MMEYWARFQKQPLIQSLLSLYSLKLQMRSFLPMPLYSYSCGPHQRCVLHHLFSIGGQVLDAHFCASHFIFQRFPPPSFIFPLPVFSPVIELMHIGLAGLAVKCEDRSDTWVLHINNSVTCFSSDHAALAAVGILGLIGLIIASTLYKAFIFTHELLPSDYAAKLNPIFDLGIQAIRTVEILVIVVIPRVFPNGVYIFLEAFGLIFMFLLYITSNTLYNSNTRLLVKSLTSFGAWVGFLEVLTGLFDSFTSAPLAGIIACGALITALVIITSGTTSKLIELLASSKKSKKSERVLLQSMFALVEIEQNNTKKDPLNDYVTISYLRHHIDHCNHITCAVNSLWEQGKLCIKKYRNEVTLAFLYSIHRKFKKILIENPDSVNIRLLYVGFLLYHLKNYMLAWEINEGTELYKVNTIQKLHIYRYRKKLKLTLQENKTLTTRSHTMEPLEMTLRNENADKMCYLIEQNGSLYGRLWDTLQDRTPSYERFVTLGFAFLKINRRIKRMWKKLVEVKGNVPFRLVALYMAYADEILHDEKRTLQLQEYMEKPELLIQNDAISQYIGAGNSVVGVSANEKDLGKIKSFNSAFCELTGYTKEELLNTKINVIIPKTHRQLHVDAFVKCCVDVEEGKAVVKEPVRVLVVHKSGYVIPVWIQIMAIPNYTNSYCFVARLKKVLDSEYNTFEILVDHNRIIVGLTSSNLFSDDLKQTRITI
eukprot:TRINITY_DN143_c0_g1_i1.p1 TRINITY_DN143_c0_g1~~TRINITY_DN143_c0_g1_i1.p1  ORF type:complete len:710 (+),score=33.15 TRINITY_DN143_c0_g1_i1:4533-6662(+)